jgi:hypothetical protein
MADDVAARYRIAVGPPVNGTVEIGARTFRLTYNRSFHTQDPRESSPPTGALQWGEGDLRTLLPDCAARLKRLAETGSPDPAAPDPESKGFHDAARSRRAPVASTAAGSEIASGKRSSRVDRL